MSDIGRTFLPKNLSSQNGTKQIDDVDIKRNQELHEILDAYRKYDFKAIENILRKHELKINGSVRLKMNDLPKNGAGNKLITNRNGTALDASNLSQNIRKYK